MFYPRTRAEPVDIETYYAGLSFVQLLVPVVTHIAIIPLICYAWRICLRGLAAAAVWCGMMSLLYHTCASWESACFGYPVSHFRTSDYVWAPFMCALLAIQVLHFFVYPWVPFVTYGVLAIIILTQTIAPFSIYIFLNIGIVLICLLIAKVTILEGMGAALANSEFLLGANTNKDLDFEQGERWHLPSLAICGALSIVAIMAFTSTDITNEWLLHGLVWHPCVFLAGYFALVGTSRNSPHFPAYLRRLDGKSPTPSHAPPEFYSTVLSASSKEPLDFM